MIADSAVIGLRCTSVGVAMSMIATCTWPLTSSRMQMYFSLSMVSDAKLMNCGWMPTFVSCTSCERESTNGAEGSAAARSVRRRTQVLAKRAARALARLWSVRRRRSSARRRAPANSRRRRDLPHAHGRAELQRERAGSGAIADLMELDGQTLLRHDVAGRLRRRRHSRRRCLRLRPLGRREGSCVLEDLLEGRGLLQAVVCHEDVGDHAVVERDLGRRHELLREIERARRVLSHDVREQHAPVRRVVDLLAVDDDLVELARLDEALDDLGPADGRRAVHAGHRERADRNPQLAARQERAHGEVESTWRGREHMAT